MPITDKFGLTLFNAADAHNTTFEEFWKAICLNDETSNFYKLENNVYSKGEIDQLIGSIETIRVIKVDELPEAGESNVIYLTPSAQSASNAFDEYLWIDSKWEQIGSTEISLDNYYNKTEIDTKLADLPQVTGNPQLTGDEPNLQGIQIGDQAYKIPENTAAREIVVNGETHAAQNGSITLPNYPVIRDSWQDLDQVYLTSITLTASENIDNPADFVYDTLHPDVDAIKAIISNLTDTNPAISTLVFDSLGNIYIFTYNDNGADVNCILVNSVFGGTPVIQTTVSIERDDETGEDRVIVGELPVEQHLTIDPTWAEWGKAYRAAYTLPAADGAASLDEFVNNSFTLLEVEQLKYIIRDSYEGKTDDQSFQSDLPVAKFIYDTDGNLFVLKATTESDADVVCFPSGMSHLNDATETKIEAILSFQVHIYTDAETGEQGISTSEVSVRDSYTKAEIQTLLAGKSSVQPNRPLAGTEDALTSLEIDGVNYKVEGGSDVIANEQLQGGEPALTSLNVDGTLYEVPGGSDVIANPTLEGTEAGLAGLEVEGVKYKVSGGEVTKAEYDWLVDSVQTLAAQSGHSLAMASYQDGTDTTLVGEDTSGNKVPIVYENASS